MSTERHDPIGLSLDPTVVWETVAHFDGTLWCINLLWEQETPPMRTRKPLW